MELIEVDSNWKDSDLRLDFVLGNLCNYKCWYCFPGSHEGTHRFPDFDLTVKNLKHLVDYYISQGKKKIFLNILGGEPTLWPRLGEFAEIFSKNNCLISMLTNGSRTIRWWEENSKYFSKINISCHHENIDVNHIRQVGDLIYENNCLVDASVLMDPLSWDKCVKIIDDLKLSKNKWTIVSAEVVHETISYTEEQKQYLLKFVHRKPNLWYFYKNNNHPVDKIKVKFNKENKKVSVLSNHIMINSLNKFKGWDCNIGVDYILIDKDGRITGPCATKLYNLDFFYNLYDLDFSEKFHPDIVSKICDVDICPCQPSANLKKRIIPLTKI